MMTISPVVLDLATRDRIRYALGYPSSMIGVATLSFGIPIARETLFLLESSMNMIMEESLPRILSILDQMDAIECAQKQILPHLAASDVGNLRLRKDESTALKEQYRDWGYKLAEVLGCPVYAFSTRYQSGASVAGGAGSIPIR